MNMHGICMEYVWKMMEYAWNTHGTHIGICGFAMVWVYFSHGIIDFYV
jgi:hypothetical protein